MWWHILTFTIVFAILILQEWKILKLNKRIFSQQQLIDLIHQVALQYLHDSLLDGSLSIDQVKTE